MSFFSMAQLLVRGLEDAVVAELRKRAALAPGGGPVSLKEQLAAMPPVGQDGDFARLRPKPRRGRR